MDSAISQRLSDVKDVKGVLRALSKMQEVRNGGFVVASGNVRGVFTFQNGYITSAALLSSDRHGKDAFQQMLWFNDAALQFIPDYMEPEDRRDALCVRIQDLIENHFSMEGIAWAPRTVAKVKTKTGQVQGFVNTGSEPAYPSNTGADTVSVVAAQVAQQVEKAKSMIPEEDDQQAVTGPLQQQQPDSQQQSSYDLSV